MPEPTSTSSLSLAAVAIAFLGPAAGPYAIIVFAAMSGALWPLSSTTTITRVAGAWLLLRCTLTAVMLTGGAAMILQRAYAIPAIESLAPLAFAIGALGNGWRPVFASIAGGLSTLAKTLGNKEGDK